MLISLVLLELVANATQQWNANAEKVNVVRELLAMANSQEEVHSVIYFGRSDNIEPYLSIAEDIPKVILAKSYSDIDFSKMSASNRHLFFVGVDSLEHKARWHALKNALASEPNYARGVFLVPRRVLQPTAHLAEHFEWCWRSGFTNVLVLVEASTRSDSQPFVIYSYEPFPVLTVQKLPWPPRGVYFNNKFINLHGYRMRTVLFNDPPSVFSWHDSRLNKTIINGYAVEVFRAFLRQHNGELSVVQFRDRSHHSLFEELPHLYNEQVDFAINVFPPFSGVRLSYPVLMLQICVLVPASEEIDAHQYFLLPFQLPIWYTCIAGLVYLTLLKAISFYVVEGRRAKLDFGGAFLIVLRYLLYLPTPCLKFKWNYAVCFVQALALGFMLSTLYQAALTSLLLTTVFNPQLNSLAELIQRNVSINAATFDAKLIQRSQYVSQDFFNLLVPRNAHEVISEVLELRRGKAYALCEDFVQFALVQQKHMTQPVFHLVDERLITVPVGFHVRLCPQFESAINEFITNAASAGLIKKWVDETPEHGLRAGLLHIRKADPVTLRPLTFDYFTFAWMIARSGNGLALLVFALENLQRVMGKGRLRIVVLFH